MADLELQLKVWKDLAISKQILIRAASDALKLDPNCSQEEFKQALNTAIKRYLEADDKVSRAEEQAKVAVSEMERRLAESKKAQDVAEAARAELEASQQKMQQLIAEERANVAQEMKKLKERLADKERELKAINTALADTPDNVVKKLKALKKQKLDESEARKQVEKTAATLRKDKEKLEQSVKEMQAVQDNAATLATQYRELHTLCQTLRDQLAPLVDDAKTLPELPVPDSALLETLEKTAAEPEKKVAGKGKR